MSEIDFNNFYMAGFIPDIDVGIFCLCGYSCSRAGLILDKDIEMFHPRNKDRIYLSDPNFQKKVYYTTFELCPKCKRAIFADGHLLNVNTIISKLE